MITAVCTLVLCTSSLLKAQTFINYTTTDGLPDNFIVGGVAVDTNNNKWFGTAAGVAKFDNTNWTVYNTTNGLIDNYTTCIAVDNNNNVWVGTNLGVSKFNGTTWTNYTTTDGLIDDAVVYIAGATDGSVWFATSVGISKLSGTTWTNYTTANGLATDVIDYIAMDPSGNKWFGTQMQGFSIYDNSTFTNVSTTVIDSLLDNNVFAIAVDKLGQKWIGTWYGITKLNNANNWAKNYRYTDGLYNNYVRDIKVDSNNNIWVGVFADYNLDGAISSFDGTHWVSYTIADGLADKQVIRLAIDKYNDVWIATGNGVSKLSNSVGINTNSSDEFSVYPNPATDVLTIKHKSMYAKASIFDLSGKLITKYELTNMTTQLDIGEINPGMYILQITDNNNTYATKLVIH